MSPRRHVVDGLGRSIAGAALVLVAATATGCGPDERAASPAPRPAAPPPVPAAAPDRRPQLVVLGDSLSAGLGLDLADAYPTLLQQKADAAGLGVRVVNAGVSGDTSAGGLSRVDLALEGDVRVMLVALGGNDGLRALPAAELRRNLAAIIERAQSRGVAVVLAGMEAPPNFGRDYTADFRQVYADLARQYKVTLIPFLLEGVAGVERLNQRDGIHPTAEGAQLIASHVWPTLEAVARTALARRPDAAPEAARR